MTAAATYLEPGSATACDLTPANGGLAAAWYGAGAFDTEAFGAETAMGYDDLSLASPPATVAGPCDRGESIVPRLLAVRGDGELYTGDLWTDILEYRRLRMRDLRGEPLGRPTTASGCSATSTACATSRADATASSCASAAASAPGCCWPTAR
ncbi:MAG: hypothetical protein IPK74_21760 [Deltaproteobacteria bacterium]|nr:hypothetical protein [Deltaproteobacteria bacterium]